MKVFEVIYYVEDGDNSQRETREYWTGDWKDVTEHAERHCEEYEHELLSVRHVLDITRQLGTSKWYQADNEFDEE